MQPTACAIHRLNKDMTGTDGSSSNPRDELSPEAVTIVGQALQVGGVSGASGLLVGGVSGVLRSTTPTLFALASAIQWFALGSSFWAARSTLLLWRGPDRKNAGDMLSASAVGGGVAGSVGGLLRGPRNILPGAIVFAIFGVAGQAVYNRVDARRSASNATTKSNGWLDSRWSPMKVLTDEEYEKMLQDKLLKVNAEIALVDENIQRLRPESQSANR